MKKQKQFQAQTYPITNFCHCAVCNAKIGLNQTPHKNGIDHLGWFDAYNTSQYFFKGSKGCYVCFVHLSETRKAEMKST